MVPQLIQNHQKLTITKKLPLMNNLVKPLAKSVSVSLWLTAAAAAANAAIEEVPWGIWFIDKRH